VVFHFMSLPSFKDNDDITEPSSDEDNECDSSVQFPMDAEPLTNYEDWNDELEKNPFEQFGYHLVEEWDKIGVFLNQCCGAKMPHDPSRNAIFVNKAPIFTQLAKASQDDIPTYMNILQPFLLGLDGLIDEMNINDPTKV
jgi:hypothetical protein